MHMVMSMFLLQYKVTLTSCFEMMSCQVGILLTCTVDN